MAVGFSFLGRAGAALAADPTGVVRVLATGAQPSATESWLILTEDAITVYSGKVELGTGIQTALTQVVVEELRLGVGGRPLRAGRHPAQRRPGRHRRQQDRSRTAASSCAQAAATAYQALLTRAAEHFGVPAGRLVAEGGRFRSPEATRAAA